MLDAATGQAALDTHLNAIRDARNDVAFLAAGAAPVDFNSVLGVGASFVVGVVFTLPSVLKV